MDKARQGIQNKNKTKLTRDENVRLDAHEEWTSSAPHIAPVLNVFISAQCICMTL